MQAFFPALSHLIFIATHQVGAFLSNLLRYRPISEPKNFPTAQRGFSNSFLIRNSGERREAAAINKPYLEKAAATKQGNETRTRAEGSRGRRDIAPAKTSNSLVPQTLCPKPLTIPT